MYLAGFITFQVAEVCQRVHGFGIKTGEAKTQNMIPFVVYLYHLDIFTWGGITIFEYECLPLCGCLVRKQDE